MEAILAAGSEMEVEEESERILRCLQTVESNGRGGTSRMNGGEKRKEVEITGEHGVLIGLVGGRNVEKQERERTSGEGRRCQMRVG